MIVVLIPTFNCRDRIEETVQSLVARDGVLFVVSDNASTDGTFEFLQASLAGRGDVVLHRLAENVGRVGNWNACLDVAESRGATGVLFLMAGDSVIADLGRVAADAKNSTDAKTLVFAPIEIDAPQGRSIARRTRNAAALKSSEDVFDRLFQRGIPFLGPLQANLFVDSSGSFPRFRMNVDGYHADQHFVVDFLADGCIVRSIDQPLARFNQRLVRTHGAKAMSQRVDGDVQFLEATYRQLRHVGASLSLRVRWRLLNRIRYVVGNLRGYA